MKIGFLSGKIKVIDLVVAILILSLSFVAIFFAFDPREAANKKHDSQFSPTAHALQVAITDHFTKLGGAPEASFGFTPATQALKTLGVYDQFSNNEFIVSNSDKFFIGKEKGTTSSYYVCYAPLSIFERDSRCNDSFVYTLNSDGTRTRVTCNVKSTWQTGNNPWVVCSPN